MNRYPMWKYILMLVLIVMGVLYALPNLYPTNPAVQISPKGNASLVGVQTKLKTLLDKQHLPYVSISKQNQQNILVKFSNTTAQLSAQNFIEALLGSHYNVAANLADNTPHWLQAIGAHPMKLGLDLQGGIHFLLAVDVNSMIKSQQRGDLHGMIKDMRRHEIRYRAVTNNGVNGIVFFFQTKSAALKAAALLKKPYANYQLKLHQSRGRFLLSAVMTQAAIVKEKNNAVDQNIHTLRNRVNALGVADPLILRQGATHISIDLPGIQDTARAKSMIGKVATVHLQLQDVDNDPVAAANGVVPFGDQLFRFHGQPVLLKDQIILQGNAIVNATTAMGQNGMPAVSLRLNGQGAELFNHETAMNIGKPLAVVYVETKAVKHLINGHVIVKHVQVSRIINIATIDSALGNSFQITGLDSEREANNLALLLRSGAYSAPVNFVEERLVGPSLGKQNIHKGVLSTELGALLVIIFMVFYYRGFGLVADAALLLNIVFIVALLSLLGATLTLPGIAGIVLTVGMAVDANVLINERIREELRSGMSPQASIFAGYGRAFMTIVDANVTTLIVAIVLFTLGSGSVQGFAVTLTLGLLTSMVTAIFFTRAVVNLVYGRRTHIKKLSIGIRVPSHKKKGA